MRILGIDPASSTGWALIEEDKLIDYGVIKIESGLHLGQRLNYVAVEIERLISKTKPDVIAIEDIIFGASGVKTLVLLARISGVIVRESYKALTQNVILVNPPEWKKSCGLQLKGSASKWEIQYAVARRFNLLTDSQIDSIDLIISDEIDKQNEIKDMIQCRRHELDKVKRNGKKLKEDSSHDEHDIKKMIDSKKKELKSQEKQSIKVYQKVQKELHSITGISEDTSDAIGIALFVQNRS